VLRWLAVRRARTSARATVARCGGPPIAIAGADPSLCVDGNELELVRLLTNLLENAARYTPTDGRIIVSVSRAGARIRVVVADTGCGIAPEHLPHLGQRFYRADPSRSRTGGGIGLGPSICLSIVAAHGGTLGIDSTLGQGTRVTVDLPLPSDGEPPGAVETWGGAG
jgi:two-component system sensor histidine kinase BaeS